MADAEEYFGMALEASRLLRLVHDRGVIFEEERVEIDQWLKAFWEKYNAEKAEYQRVREECDV